MLDSKNDREARQEGSLLSLGEALRASRPAAQHSRLAEALAQVRAEQQAATVVSADESARPLPNFLKRPSERSDEAEAAAPSIARSQSGVAWSRSEEPDETHFVTNAEAVESRAAPKPIVPTAEPVAQPGLTPSPVVAPIVVPVAPQPHPGAAGRPAAWESADSPEGWRPLIDPSKVVAGVFRSKKIIVATTILGTALGVLVALNTPKTYDAATEMLADPRDLNLVEKELTQSGISNEATLAIVDNQVRILTSGGVLTKVVNRLKLAEDPEFNGQGSGGIGGLIGKVRSAFFGSDAHGDPGRRQALATENLSKALAVERSGKTFIIVVRARTQNAEKSALIANTMSDVFLESSGDIQSDAAGRAASELTGKLDELRKGVEAAERKVEAFRAENDLIDAQGRLITDDEILKLNEQLSVARARTLELNARAASTRNVNIDSVLNGAIPEELASASIQELRAQYASLKGEADRVAVRLGPKHPSYMAIQAQLSGARDLINTEIRRVISSNQTELKRAVQLEQELASRLAQLKIRQGSLSNQLVTLREIEREATAKRAVYESFLLRAKETGEQQGINSANISVISKAAAPLNANGPSRALIAGAGTFLGLLFGIGIGGARGTFDSLRGTAGGDFAPVGPRGGNPRRRRRATMFDSPEETTTADAVPIELKAAPPAPGAAQDSSTSKQPQTADTPAQPKDEPMHQYQPDHWAFEQPQHPQGQPANAGMPMQGYAHAPAPTGYVGAPQMYAPQPQAYAPPQPYGYPQPMQGQSMYHPQPQPQPDSYVQPAPMPQHAYPQAVPNAYWPQQHNPGMQQPPVYAQAPMPHPVAYAPTPTQLYAQPRQQNPGHRAQPVQPSLQSVPKEAANTSQIDEIRASLRECRAAIRELAEARSGRRYF